MIRLATTADAAAIATIYNHYVSSSTITFEEQIVSIDEMAQRIASVGAQLPWYVFERDGEIVGYAYATPWRSRSAYRFSVESTVYVAHECMGRGVGRQLYSTLIDDLRQRKLQVVIGGIAQPNDASVALHERLGFEKWPCSNELAVNLISGLMWGIGSCFLQNDPHALISDICIRHFDS